MARPRKPGSVSHKAKPRTRTEQALKSARKAVRDVQTAKRETKKAVKQVQKKVDKGAKAVRQVKKAVTGGGGFWKKAGKVGKALFGRSGLFGSGG
jgi:hypothetical protein